MRRHLIANFVGQGWAALAGVMFVPVYIHFLGVEAFGLIGLSMVLITVVGLLDAGMTPTLNREFARFSVGAVSAAEARRLLRTIEALFGAIVCTVGATGVAVSWLFAAQWINASALSAATVRGAVSAIALVAALRLVEGMYRGAMLGLGHHVWMNTAVAALATLRNGGAAVVVALDPSIVSFFVWQIFASIVSIAVLAIGTYRSLRGSGAMRIRPSLASLRSIRGFALGVLFTSVLGIALTQLDKIVLTHMISLEAFGYYTLASTVSNALYQFVTPIAQTFYPRMTALYESGSRDLARIYDTASQLLTLSVGAPALVLAFFAHPVLSLWTQKPLVADQTALILTLLSIGTMLHGIMHIPYTMQLAAGWTRLAVGVNIGSVILFIPAILVFVPRYGAIAAAWIWIALNVGYIIVTINLMHRRILRDGRWRWYVQDTFLPLLVGTVSAAALSRIPMASEDWVAVFQIILDSALVFTSMAATIPSVWTRIMSIKESSND